MGVLSPLERGELKSTSILGLSEEQGTFWAYILRNASITLYAVQVCVVIHGINNKAALGNQLIIAGTQTRNNRSY